MALLCLIIVAGFAAIPSCRAAQITVTNSASASAGVSNGARNSGSPQSRRLPSPPPDYRPNDKHRVRKWVNFRNSIHNFNFYVIGLADKTFHRSGRFPAEVLNPHKHGWNWAVCKYKWVRLPFLSYHRRHFQFYFLAGASAEISGSN